ncbi:MAG: dihydroorotate dehydrogenase-like protein [Pirellulaceae bacterium]|nr:dihydroorotate dehydrogenase-like protein [Pirellulaceae bacterium]
MKTDITANYLGMELDSPVVVGACPITLEPETVRQLVCVGVGAIVLPSILQEQIVYAKMRPHSPIEAIESSGFRPQQDKYNGGPANYLQSIAQLKSNFNIPIIASISVASEGDWLDYTKQIATSGADALELNFQSVTSNPNDSADDIENKLCRIAQEVCASVSIPVAVKLSQRFTNIASIAKKMQAAGAAGLILFAHTPQWDVSIDQMHWTIRWELSPVNSLGAVLEGIVRARAGGLEVSIAASGGVRSSEDALKSMIAGADVVMITSEIYRKGPDAVRDITDGIQRYLASSLYDSLLSFQKARPSVSTISERLTRLEYVDPLTRSTRYDDPTPVAARARGDSFGHETGLI